MTIVITGATGLVGRPLVRQLLADGHDIRVLTRDVQRARQQLPARCRPFTWNPAAGTIDAAALAGAQAVVSLAGEGVAEGRWTAARKRAIRESRVAGTRLLVQTLASLPEDGRPTALISASAIGVYGDRGDELLDEEAVPGSGFLAEVCTAWEREVGAAERLGVRVAIVRVGIVLGKEGGALARMLPPFRLGLGGRIGSGRQWMSWIHLDDLVSLVAHATTHGEVRGVLNGVAPEPVRNADFTRTLGRALGRPTVFPVPAIGLRTALGEMAGILLASQRVVPQAAVRAGFAFRHPTLPAALADLLADRARTLELEQWVPRPPAEVFPFFSSPRNLELLTPPFVGFEVLGSSTPDLQKGTTIDYRLRLHGVPVRWQSVIESWDPPHGFADLQTRGPYKLWHHSHEFEPHEGGTIIRDRVRYEVPFGAAGALVGGALVTRDLAAIFRYRQEQIAARFGAPAGSDAPAAARR
jgi:uncharacterized protein (TIGR01777 family)